MPELFAPPADPDTLTTVVVALVTAATLAALALPRVRRSRPWRATVTPLASIIGSGFLVVAPLLASAVGRWAVVAMAGIVVLAQLVGSAMRYVVAHAEAVEEGDVSGAHAQRALVLLGGVAKTVLAGAYLVAVAFYLQLLGAFVMRVVGMGSDPGAKVFASVVLAGIALFGAVRGLAGLEWIEEGAVSLKLAIIAGLLAGLALHDVGIAVGANAAAPAASDGIGLRELRVVLGAFLVVQGFETSRFLRGAYERGLRIVTMRRAQWIAAGIYLAFVGLATPILGALEGHGETAILDLSARVSFLLPGLLALGAVASQFSAAVADTIGSGGLLHEVGGRRVPKRIVYPVIAAASLALIWTQNVFEVIAWASRAFALAYALYCAMAAVRAATRRRPSPQPARAAGFAALALAMLVVAVAGIPAEAA